MASPASAQLAVNDAAANATLSSILAELQTQTTIMNEQTDRLNEIKALNEDILDAVCGKSTIGTRVAAALDTDLTNASVLPLSLLQTGLPEGFDTPSTADVQSIQRSASDLFGLARRAYAFAEQAQRIGTSGNVGTEVRRLERLGRAVMINSRLFRENALVESVEGAYSFGTYSLANMGTAKGRETSMNQVRTSADCLREDVNALNRSMLEVLSRMNHLISLQANATALDAAWMLQGLPITTAEELEPGQ